VTTRTAITVHRSREEVERLWSDPALGPEAIADSGAEVTFADAPGDRGTEIHVDLQTTGKLGDALQKLRGAAPRAKIKDALRHFKQRVETGDIPRSDASPEGESVARKFKQRPAQPLETAGVS
jgi:hypothetical protein